MRLQKLVLPGFDIDAAKIIAKRAMAAISDGELGHGLIVASKLKCAGAVE